MSRLACSFKGQLAGYIATERLEPSASAYQFFPARSLAHLRLVEHVSRNGSADVKVDDHGDKRSYEVVELSPRSITLQPR